MRNPKNRASGAFQVADLVIKAVAHLFFDGIRFVNMQYDFVDLGSDPLAVSPHIFVDPDPNLGYADP